MNNSEILFIYDAQMCNPNGDPDEENRPRMDYATQTNLVSDVRYIGKINRCPSIWRHHAY